ncbi:hypothetical protein [Yersinia massiliensis]|uniref:Uncharacterized protein n=1 Tax=Yersinia massiliensis TaxID=419257 RepID=A0ABM6UYT3_9GAMM|nr:hypothetical protein [Yersinia massiliensis]AVX39781.1 hypothetical protein DA391_20250 [Yersinia massiliensis]
MNEFLALIAAVAIWVIVGKLLSRHFIRKGHKVWLSKTSGTIVGAVVALFFLILLIPTQDNDNPKTAAIDTSTAQTHAQPKEGSVELAPKVVNEPVDIEPKKTLEITPEVFAKRMNANLKETGSLFRLRVHVKSGEVNDTFNYTFNDHLAIVGTVDKVSQKLSGITLITSGDGTTKSGIDVMAIVVSAYSAALGENTMKTGEPAKLMMKLVELDKKVSEGESAVSTIFNGIKFSFMSSDTIGNWFTAEPI